MQMVINKINNIFDFMALSPFIATPFKAN